MVPPPPRFYTDRRRSRSPLGVSSHSGRGERNLPPRHFKNGQPYSEYRPKVRVDGNINNIRREFGLPRYDVPRHGRVFEQSSAPWAQRSRSPPPMSRVVRDVSSKHSNGDLDYPMKRPQRHTPPPRQPTRSGPMRTFNRQNRNPNGLRSPLNFRGFLEERPRGRALMPNRGKGPEARVFTCNSREPVEAYLRSTSVEKEEK
ncbi:unnamed protein product [Mesocestoides corti]|uniref:Uncharacterized protein n=1 Tax=Mesocestoides corti TaxID=53468 RepID=A0A0R3U286_MESCO|nr:unnamed protein product [Mesocestoides corti]